MDDKAEIHEEKMMMHFRMTDSDCSYAGEHHSPQSEQTLPEFAWSEPTTNSSEVVMELCGLSRSVVKDT